MPYSHIDKYLVKPGFAVIPVKNHLVMSLFYVTNWGNQNKGIVHKSELEMFVLLSPVIPCIK